MGFSQSTFDALGVPAPPLPAVAAAVIPPLPGAGRDLITRVNPGLLRQSAAFFIRQQNDPRPVFETELPVNQEGILVELQRCFAADDFAGFLSCECLVTAAGRELAAVAVSGCLLMARCRTEVAATPYYPLRQIRGSDWQLLPGGDRMLPRAVFTLKFAVNTAAIAN